MNTKNVKLIFDVPGFADEVSDQIIFDWNERIQILADRSLKRRKKSKFLLDPADLLNGQTTNACKWPINPAMVRACLSEDEDLTRELCDWGLLARLFLHNEYAEYKVVRKKDDKGRMRPKRVIVSTELREYWGALAAYQPEKLKEITQVIAGREIRWQEIYGPDLQSPNDVEWDERERRFNAHTAGFGRYRSQFGWHPRGTLNAEFNLFMMVPINGLQHLIDVVALGAQAFVVMGGDDKRREATKYEILGQNARACRHADATVALTASRIAHLGQQVAFANPLGVYINTDVKALTESFYFENKPAPPEWVKLSRGKPGMYQRLEFGPRDDDPVFLDEIFVATGNEERRVAGGFDVVSKIEVGPLMAIGDGPTLGDDDFVEVKSVTNPLGCHKAKECAQFVVPLLNAYKNR